MRKTLRYSLRALVLAAVVYVSAAILAPPGTPRGPYVSALSDLAVPVAMAVPRCTDKGCPLNNNTCSHKVGFDGCALVNGACQDKMCLH